MSEINIKITETQLKMLVQMMNMVQVKLAEAPELLDLKKRLDSVEVKEK
jgi:hypothetical protein